ncbi:hypothetical protein QUB05_08230 [Microcoleus sp. F10-C6]|uniref:hypothetical protein n=1 Tax=unclassified Microcoleus TaxID=2642155 RepID=UPI002FD387A0
MNSEDSSHRFFCAERPVVRGYGSDGVGSGTQGQQRMGCDRVLGRPRPKTDTCFPTGVVSRPKF